MDQVTLPVDALEPLRGLRLQDRELLLELTDYRTHVDHKVPTYFFRMVQVPSGTVCGSLDLRVGSSMHVERYAGHIGCGVLPGLRGHHYAARSVVLIKPLAHRLGLNPMWITCDPENEAARRSLELAGAVFVEIVVVPMNCGIRIYGGKTRKCRYRL